jgi:hypothetical protein
MIELDETELNRAWDELAKDPLNNGDKVCLHPQFHEAWEYMGSNELAHNFRHRCHPSTGRRVSIKILKI